LHVLSCGALQHDTIRAFIRQHVFVVVFSVCGLWIANIIAPRTPIWLQTNLVGASGAVYGVIGAWFAHIIQNWCVLFRRSSANRLPMKCSFNEALLSRE
jgi:membrane associated rhomboid family serine protease